MEFRQGKRFKVFHRGASVGQSPPSGVKWYYETRQVRDSLLATQNTSLTSDVRNWTFNLHLYPLKTNKGRTIRA